MMTSVTTPGSFTAEWLTERLREADHSTAEVKSFVATPIGTGQMGKCIRYELDLAGADESTPRSLVGKFPSDDPLSRQTAVALKSYLKEVSFYRDLQPRLTISTPRCYHAEIDGDGPDFALLLEDMAPAAQGDQLAGCSVDVARVAMQELVGLHAPSWCDEEIRATEWLGAGNEASSGLIRALYRAQLPGFFDRYGAHLAPDEAKIIERVADSKGLPFDPPGEPFAVVHVDYRLDNLLIDATAHPPRVSVVDWQTITVGSPLNDVCYFMGASLLREDRLSAEDELVRAYHQGLQEAGVEGYAWDQCWGDYRRGAFAGVVMAVVASMIVQQTERGDAMFTAMAVRHSRHAIDIGADEFLG
jgi:hypothetical protein